MASPEEHAGRIELVRAELERQDVDCLLVGPSSDLVYLAGFPVKPSERLTLLVLAREGAPLLMLPDFELPSLKDLPLVVEPVPWSDGDDATALIGSMLPRGRSITAALGGQTQARLRFAVERAAPHLRWIDGDALIAPVRLRKSREEIAALRAASGAADAVLGELVRQGVGGRTERELVDEIRRLLAAHGNDPTGSGLAAFGPHSAAPHHVVTGRPARAGDCVIVDFGGTRHGYRADVTRTYHVGEPPKRFRRIYEVVREANARAIEHVRPGVTAERIDAVAREHIVDAGFGAHFSHRTGHGIGLDVHEPPYLVRGDATVLEQGMAFTVEPGIYLPGEFGVRIEDVVLVTADGGERLNHHPRELKVVE
jgi:Xaa-Pro aminopeptidase